MVSVTVIIIDYISLHYSDDFLTSFNRHCWYFSAQCVLALSVFLGVFKINQMKPKFVTLSY